MSVGLLLVTIITFSGFATATTISNTGSNVHYISSSQKWVNNWYITTSTDKKSSTFVFKGKLLKHTSKGWNTIETASMTVNFLKVNITTTKITEKAYTDGKLVFSKSTTSKTKLTPLNFAKAFESHEINYLKTTL
jgi:hypothetical protein